MGQVVHFGDQVLELKETVPDEAVLPVRMGQDWTVLFNSHNAQVPELFRLPIQSADGDYLFIVGLHEQGLVLNNGQLLTIEPTWSVVQQLMDGSFLAGMHQASSIMTSYFAEGLQKASVDVWEAAQDELKGFGLKVED